MNTSGRRSSVAVRRNIAVAVLTLVATGIFLCGPGAKRGWCQAYSASLAVNIIDPQGAAMAGAHLSLRNSATGETRVGQSGPDGLYAFSQLPPGSYDLTVTVSGFKTFTQRGILLQAQVASALNVTMQIGETKSTVEVTAAAPLLDTQTANQQSTLNRAMVTELPTGVQSPLPLVLGLAGTTTLGMNAGVSGNLTDQVQDQNLSRFALNGGRDMGNLILLDGSPDTASDWGGLLVSPSSDSVQEMQVIRSTYDAQFGKTGGGVVSLVTRGGSDQIHGQAYGYLRNDNLDATTWSGNAYTVCDPSLNARQCSDLKKPEYKREEFGGNIGGPIWRRKHVYFFAAYDGLRVPALSNSGVQSVPTALERQGDFSQSYNSDGSLQLLYNPFSTTFDPATGNYIRQPFDPSCAGVMYPNTCAGNKIPQNLINPVGAKVLALFPTPNLAGDPMTHANNFFGIGGAETVNDHIDGRVDWAHNQKHSMYVRWSQRIRENQPTPDFFGNGATNVQEYKDPGYQGVIGNTFTPNPTWVVSVLLASGRWNESQLSPAQGKLTPASIGLNPAYFQAQLMPPFAFDNYTSLGNGEIRNFIRYEDTLQVDATKQKGAHSIKFGAYLESALLNDIDNFTGPPQYSPFFFGRDMTAGPVANQTSATTGNAIASLLLGAGSSGGPSVFNPDLAIHAPYYGFYGEDIWRVTPKLTLTLGLRYDLQPGATERFNRWTLFDLNSVNPLAQGTGLPLKGDFMYVNGGNRGLWPTDYRNFAPRIGLAYQVTPKLVARAGYGIFYLPAQSLIGFDAPGQDVGFSTFTPWINTSPSNPFLPLNLISNPYPSGVNPPTGRNTTYLDTVGNSWGQMWPKGFHPTPYKQNFSLDFQYQLKPSAVLEIGYSGYRARKLVFGNPALNFNQLPDQYLTLGNGLNQPVANPFAAAVTANPALANTFLAGGPCPATISAPSCLTQGQLLEPFPEFGSLQWSRSLPGASANFDSLWVKFTHQFASGLTLLSSYQWSKALDDGSEDQGWELGSASSPWRDFYNRKLEYSVSAHDVPQSFVTSLVYELPVGRGKRLGSGWSGAANAVAGGWQVSSIVRLTSGFPLNINAPGNGAPNGGAGYPDLTSTGVINVGNRTPNQWFNTCSLLLNNTGGYYRNGCSTSSQALAWIQAPLYSYGNAPRYISNLRTDWTRNVDLSLAKNFQATERIRVQFRADAFNLLNTPIFNSIFNFDTGITSPTFGQVFGTGNSPREIQLGLRVTF